MPVFCAHVSDGDSRERLQQAIDEARLGDRVVELEPGVYRITRHPRRAASLVLDGVTLRGRGAVLSMMGPGRKEGDDRPSDWILTELRGDAPRLLQLDFDGTDRVETGEQTHFVQLTGPCWDALIEDVRMRMPPMGEHEGGDCIRLLGERYARVSDTTVRHVMASVFDRSFLSFQRGVDGFLAEYCESMRGMDSAIEMEPTGADEFGDSPCIQHVEFRDCDFTGAERANTAAAIGGRGKSLADQISLRDVTVRGGGISLIDCGVVNLERVVCYLSHGDEPSLMARKRVQSLRALDCWFGTGGSNRAEATIKVARQAGLSPGMVTLINCQVNQEADRPAVCLEWHESFAAIQSKFANQGGSVKAFEVRGEGSISIIDCESSGWTLPWPVSARLSLRNASRYP
jgi:hypothetical protein